MMDEIWNHALSHTTHGDFTVGDLITFAEYVFGGVCLFAVVLNCIAQIFPKERD